MQLIPKVIEGEVLTPRATIRVVGRRHPLSGGRVEYDLPAGLSISEILERCAGDVYAGGFVVHLDGHPILSRHFARVRVKPGVTLTFVPRLQNSPVWRIVATAVVAIAAFAIAGPLAGTLFAAGTVALSVATAVITAGIMLAGTLAINALFPVRPAQVSNDATSTSLNSIQGAQNQTNPFGSVPVVLGRHRQSPYYAAKPYTEIVGDDQYLRLLFCLGYGPLQIDSIQVGETPLASFSDVQIEVRQGLSGDAPVTLYPGEVDEVALSIQLDDVVDGAGVIGSGGYWQSQSTSDQTDEISVDFTATQGCYHINKTSGAVEDWTIPVNIRYRPLGGSSWTTAPVVYFTRSASPVRLGLNIGVSRGQYEVQVQKGSGNGDPSQVRDTIVWTAIRSIKRAAPVTFPKALALIALRIKATNQLSGVISTLNCITTSLVNAYSGSGSTWTANTASQNPADLFRHVLQGPANARPRTDAQIDIAGLQAWWAYCVTSGFKFNQVLNSVGSVYDKLCDIAAAGRAVPAFIDGKWGVVWDRPADPIVQHFTPRNSWGMQLQHPYAQQPHGWRVSFINEANGFTQDERIVYDDGYSSLNATLFEGMQFPGVTDPALIWKHGRFHIAQARLRPEKLSLSVGWEHLVCTRGDRVRVTHDVMLIGLASGRLKSVSGQIVTFDEVVTIEAAKTYAMTVRVPDDARSVTRAVDPATAAGDYTQLTLVGDLSLLSAGQLFGFGETNQVTADYRVQSIAHDKNLVATLTLVDDAPAISTADSGTIPDYNPNVTIPADPFTLPPRDLRYLEVIDGQGASARAVVQLIWQVPRFGNITSFEVQQRDDNSGSTEWARVDSVSPPRTDSEVGLVSAGIWSFRVRCIFADGSVSSWATLDHITLQGLSRAPDPIANLRQTFINGRSFLSWDIPVDPRAIPIEVRKGTSFAAAQVVEDAAVSPWQTVGDDTYWVSAYAVSPFGTRVYAQPTQSIAISGSVAIENLVVGHDERSEMWTGSFSGSVGIDQSNNFLRTAGDDDFLGRSDFLGNGNFIDGDGTQQAGGIYWSAHIVDTGGLNYCRVSNDWTATGVAATDDFLGNSDFLANLDFLKASLSQYVRIRPVIRIAMAGGVPSWGATQIWSPDVYYGWQYQLGIQFEILDPTQNAIAYLLSWTWSIDVPDRFDSYQHLTVPIGGLAITFRPSGATTDIPFHGGPNNEDLPHMTPSIRNPNPGDLVVWESLTLAGVTLKVKNSGSDVGGSEVNLLVRGY